MKIQLKKWCNIVCVFIAGSLLFTACQNTDKSSTETAEKNNSKTIRNTGGLVFENEEGEQVSLDALKGKVVFINFWATWCPPCRRELPSIENLKKSFKGNEDIVFLMVDIEGKMKKSTQYMKNNQLDLPVYIPKTRIPSNYLGNAIPTTVILDKNGDIATRVEGARDYATSAIKESIQEMIDQK